MVPDPHPGWARYHTHSGLLMGVLGAIYPKIRQTYKTNGLIFGYITPPPPQVTHCVRVSDPSLGGGQGP